MTKSEREILDELQSEAERADTLFSMNGQALQERTIVAGLLRVLGVDFNADELIKSRSEPVDIQFREGLFQVTEILDEGRRRNLEVKKRYTRIKNATSLNELIEPGTVFSKPISVVELQELASRRAIEKALKYAGACNEIDLLIYANLQHRHLYPIGEIPKDVDAFSQWRSVSVVMEGLATVFWAAASAPDFLLKRKGVAFGWTKLDSVFPELESARSEALGKR